MDYKMAEHCFGLMKAIGKLHSTEEVWGPQQLEGWLAEELTDMLDLAPTKLSKYRNFLGSLHSFKDVLCDALGSIDGIIKEVQKDIQSIRPENNIYILPDEILSKIFEQVVNVRDNRCSLPAISRRIRKVALETPRLWTIISSKHSRALNALYLERSKAAGLTIVFERSARLEEYADFVLEQCDRWSEVYFGTGKAEVLDTSRIDAKLGSKHFPNLKAIYYDPICYDSNKTHEPFPFSSWNMPHLRLFKGEAFLPPAPWVESLTDCSLTFFGPFDINELLHVLEHLKACRSLELRFLRNRFPDEVFESFDFSSFVLQPPSTVCLPKLESLSVMLTEREHINLFEILTAEHIPLKQLHNFHAVLHSRLQSRGIDWQNFKFSKLTRMTLRYSNRYDLSRHDRQNMPKLEHLEIVNSDSPCSSYMSHIEHGYHTDSVLKSITFRDCDRLGENHLLRMTEALCKPGFEHFKELCIYNCKLQEYFLHRLEKSLPGKVKWVV